MQDLVSPKPGSEQLLYIGRQNHTLDQVGTNLKFPGFFFFFFQLIFSLLNRTIFFFRIGQFDDWQTSHKRFFCITNVLYPRSLYIYVRL